jgi:hypothetical protein
LFKFGDRQRAQIARLANGVEQWRIWARGGYGVEHKVEHVTRCGKFTLGCDNLLQSNDFFHERIPLGRAAFR